MLLSYQKPAGFFVKYLMGIEKYIQIILWSELDGVASSPLNLLTM